MKGFSSVNFGTEVSAEVGRDGSARATYSLPAGATPGYYQVDAFYGGIPSTSIAAGLAQSSELGLLTVAPGQVTLQVSGSQSVGSAQPSFSAEAGSLPPGVVLLDQRLSCSRVGAGPSSSAIGPGLAAGAYTIDGRSCSGAVLVGPESFAYRLGYADGIFKVHAQH